MLASDLDGRHQEIAEKAHTGAKDLVSLSNKARGIEELVETDHTVTHVDLVALLKRLRGYKTGVSRCLGYSDSPRNL